MNTLTLTNCNPEPLASYLKALGVFRLLVEQGKDPAAKAFWQDDCFVLQTKLSAEELAHFFCEEYAPTPIVSPWNGSSGFYPGDNTAAMDAICASDNPRLQTYRATIEDVRSWPELPAVYDTPEQIIRRLNHELERTKPGKKRDELSGLVQEMTDQRPPGFPDSDNAALLDELAKQARKLPKEAQSQYRGWLKALKKGRTRCTQLERGAGKEQLLAAARARLPDVCLKWLDAACALRFNDKPAYNPLLGSGGNDGRLDFSNNFMQRIVQLLLVNGNRTRGALFETAISRVPHSGMLEASIGQYDPGRAGGFNQGSELETKNFKINPWDFVLSFEGTLALASALVRRSQAGARPQLASPFTVYPSAIGFSSSHGGEKARAETWLPIWSRPVGLSELSYLLAEGRTTVGRRPARTGMDFSRAVGSLGVARGFDAFVRFSYLERRGKSYVALPTGRLAVRYQPALRLLDELDPLLDGLDRFLRKFENPPARLQAARRRVDQALFSCTQQADAHAFQALVRSLGRIEAELATRDLDKKPSLPRPLGGLSPRWIAACDDGGNEVQLAAALASIRSTGPVGPVRSYLAGVDPRAPWKWAAGGRRWWTGRDLPARLGKLLHRRLLDADRQGCKLTPLQAHLPIHIESIAAFLHAQVDDAAVEELLWGFTWVSWDREQVGAIRNSWACSPSSPAPVSRTWCLLKLLLSPRLSDGLSVPRDARVAALLQAHRIAEAAEAARHRLRVSSLRPHLVSYEAGSLDPERLWASLIFPVRDLWRAEQLVLQPNNQN